MLTILFSEKKDAETKRKELTEKFGMIMTETVEGGLRSMCNLGAGMAERAIREGLQQGLQQGEERICKLIAALLSDGLTDEIALVTSDATEREKYYKKYGIN